MNNRGLLKSDVLRLGVLAGLCLLIGVQQIHKPALINPDGVFYISLAQRLPDGYVSAARTYPPGYPVILWMAHGAASLLAGSDSPRLWLDSSQHATVLCQMLALLPLYLLGKLLVGGVRSFWALLILLVLPYPAQFAHDVLREWPHVLFLGLGFWLLYWALHRRQWWALALVGWTRGWDTSFGRNVPNWSSTGFSASPRVRTGKGDIPLLRPSPGPFPSAKRLRKK